MEDALFKLLLTVTTTIITIIGTLLTNYLNHKVGCEKTKNYTQLAKQVVMAIEQLNPELKGIDKKELAQNKLIEISNNKLTKEQADILIESSIYEIKNFLKK